MAQESGRVNTKRRIKAVLFDLDGVLIDSIDAWYVALNETLRKFGKKKIGKGEYVKTVSYTHLTLPTKRIV